MGGLFLLYFSIAAMISQFGQSFAALYVGR
jgi:flagellar biosynthetic protein FliR